MNESPATDGTIELLEELYEAIGESVAGYEKRLKAFLTALPAGSAAEIAEAFVRTVVFEDGELEQRLASVEPFLRPSIEPIFERHEGGVLLVLLASPLSARYSPTSAMVVPIEWRAQRDWLVTTARAIYAALMQLAPGAVKVALEQRWAAEQGSAGSYDST